MMKNDRNVFQPIEIIKVLTEAEVEFILVGGLAVVAHGGSLMTRDFDAVVSLTEENCRRILTALEPFEPRFYQTIGKPRVERTAKELSKFKNLYFGTRIGIVDLLGSVPPIGDYQAVLRHSIPIQLYGFSARMIGLEDLIAVKTFVGRPKDKLAELELKAILRKTKNS